MLKDNKFYNTLSQNKCFTVGQLYFGKCSFNFTCFFSLPMIRKKHFDKQVEMSSIRKYISQEKILLFSNLILRSESGPHVFVSLFQHLSISISASASPLASESMIIKISLFTSFDKLC